MVVITYFPKTTTKQPQKGKMMQ